MTDQYVPPAGGGDGARGVVENPMNVLLFGFLTCGIYCIYWMWLRVKEMNTYLGKEQVNPMFIFPGCLCFPLVWYADHLFAQGLPEMQQKAGVPVKDDYIMDLLLLILLAPVGQYMIQQKLNEIWSR
jgi:Domain of unknown function (DUF4234)